jgi:hypothetical protein
LSKIPELQALSANEQKALISESNARTRWRVGLTVFFVLFSYSLFWNFFAPLKSEALVVGLTLRLVLGAPVLLLLHLFIVNYIWRKDICRSL